jgi:hypothetical protein
MDSRHDIDLPMQIALGWTLYVVTMVFGFSAHILFSIFERNNFASLFDDPGRRASRFQFACDRPYACHHSVMGFGQRLPLEPRACRAVTKDCGP